MKTSAKLITIFFFLVFLGHVSAYKLYPGWFKHYGGAQGDYAESIQQTSDGGYVIAGYTNSYTHGNEDFAIYKLDSNGDKVWFKHYGGIFNDRGTSIQQTSDGGYVAAGYTYSYTHGDYDFAIYKLDSNGNKDWFRHYGGTGNDKGFSIQQTSDGGYVIAGYSNSYTYGTIDLAIYKLGNKGNKVWFKHYGGAQGDYAESIQQTSDGGYVVAGFTYSYVYGDANADFAIYKLDSNGDKAWFKHYGGTGQDVARSIQQTSDGEYIVGGYTTSYTHGGYDFAVYKLDSNGNKVWFKHYGGTEWDRGQSIRQASDGGYIISGSTASFSHGSTDFSIYKLDSNGNKSWFKHYGGANSEYSYSIKQTSDEGYIVAGKSDSFTHGGYDFAIYKLDSNGNK